MSLRIAFEAVVILSKSCLSEGDILSCEVKKVNSISDAPQRKEFLRNHTNIKVRLIMACLMEKQVVDKRIVRLSIFLKQK